MEKEKAPPASPPPAPPHHHHHHHRHHHSPTHQNQLKEIQTDTSLKKHEKDKLLHAELDYIHFPTILGWHFDGLYTEAYGLNEDYAIHFNELQAELDVIADYENEETFTEQARRYFW